MKILFAPLQGYTDNAYRRLHHQLYGGVDTYFTPFIRVEKGAMRRQDMTRLLAMREDDCPTVPQIIFNSIDEFDILWEAIRSAGFTRIDLNLGCPYPMQTRKGRGAALISNETVMREVANRIMSDKDCGYSVKMRLGMQQPTEWRELMPVLNEMSLVHIAVHPRIAVQKYGGEMFAEEFAAFVAESVNPVVWNGDVQSIEDINRLSKQYPQMPAVMIGRGLLARPSLAVEYAEGQEWDERTILRRVLGLHDALFEEYRTTLCGETQILQKIRPFWDYLEPVLGHKWCKRLRKATTVHKYLGELPF